MANASAITERIDLLVYSRRLLEIMQFIVLKRHATAAFPHLVISR